MRSLNTREEVDQSKADLRFTEKERAEALKHILSTKPGRRFVWWLLSKCRIFHSTIGEHYVMAFTEGKRTVGLEVFRLTQFDNESRALFSEMQKENITEADK
jgi:hypothetical protein